MLDGGLILLFLIESIRRKPLSLRFKEAWQRFGLALIVALSLFVILNDLLRLISGKKF
jgi:regulator of sigma E protease